MQSINLTHHETNNIYLKIFIDKYIKVFRNFITNKFEIKIKGLASFISNEDQDDISYLLHSLELYGFNITISAGTDNIDEIQVEYIDNEKSKHYCFDYRIENLISIISLSSMTGISVVGILIMQILSNIICKTKIVYKAIILDLDDTLWKGTLSEDGFDVIKQNLNSSDATSYIRFMKFIRILAKEFGVYVALCSRNNIKTVLYAIEKLSENEFPIKGQIDCILANDNDKSENIKAIAQQLSVLTNACVFIDDNQIIRDEVCNKLPEVFVPNWKNHDELLTIIEACCIFDRIELSKRSRNRKHLMNILQQERKKNNLPQLYVTIHDDVYHDEAHRLYAKSNQFKFSDKNTISSCCKSIVFEIFRDSGESLGICSAITYSQNAQELHISNWAISCRYFEIGLEEFILLYLHKLSKGKRITFNFIETAFNKKVVNLIEKYKNMFLKDSLNNKLNFIPDLLSLKNLQVNTNLEGK